MKDIGISQKFRKDICHKLEELLATTYALYLKTQNCHWNVVGPHFQELHLLFEDHYSEMAKGIDEIAERIRILGFHAPGSFSHFSKHSSIADLNKKITTKEMLKQLLDGHFTVIRLARDIMPYSDQAADGVTSDLMIKRLTQHEKATWQLSSLLA
jgi:starvation-inducible DNA-binding protein